MSDAVDSTISKIDFRPIAGRKVYLDTTYIQLAGKAIPGVAMPVNLVSADYVISGIRQQMLAAGCNLVEKKRRSRAYLRSKMRCLRDMVIVLSRYPAAWFVRSVDASLSIFIPAILRSSYTGQEPAPGWVACFAYERTHEPVWQKRDRSGWKQCSRYLVLWFGTWQAVRINISRYEVCR